jgi:hypothetical protein
LLERDIVDLNAVAAASAHVTKYLVIRKLKITIAVLLGIVTGILGDLLLDILLNPPTPLPAPDQLPVPQPSPNPRPGPNPTPPTELPTTTPTQEASRIVLVFGPGANFFGEIVPLVAHYAGRAKVVGIESDSDKVLILQSYIDRGLVSSNDFEIIQTTFSGTRAELDRRNIPCALAAFSLWPGEGGELVVANAINQNVCPSGDVYVVSEIYGRFETIVNGLSNTAISIYRSEHYPDTVNGPRIYDAVSPRCMANPADSFCRGYGDYSFQGVGFTSIHASTEYSYIFKGMMN